MNRSTNSHFQSLDLNKIALILFLNLFSLITYAQINYSENFTGCAANPCHNWAWSDVSGSMTAVSALGYTPCAVADAAARINLSATTLTANLSPTVSLGTSSGEFAYFGFSYKCINNVTGSATPANSCTFTLESAVSPVGPWTLVESFQNISATACAPFVSSKFFPPAGQPIFVRIRMNRNSGDFWAVVDDITLTQPAPSVIESTACSCDNNQTPNNLDGTFTTNLVIRYADNSAMESGLVYTLKSSTGLSNSMGLPIGNPTFVQCSGGCPAGVLVGQYYLTVRVQNSGMYSATVDGPDPNTIADLTLSNTTCGTLYPALPIIPFNAKNCLTGGINTFSSDGGVYNINNTQSNPVLPTGFSQTGTGSLMVDNSTVNEANNNPTHELYLIKETAGCRVTSYEEFKIFKELKPLLEDRLYDCRDTFSKDTIVLTNMIASDNSGVGKFFINGNEIPNGRLGISGPLCTDVTYTLTDSCGVVKSDTKKLQVIIKPKPSFNFGSGPGAPRSPICSSSDVSVTLIRNSNGPNPVFTVTPNTATISGNTLTLPAPASVNQEIKYKVCLSETNNAATACGTIPTPTTLCTDTLCKYFTVYRDKSDCGANAIFTSTCDEYEPAYCQTYFVSAIRLKCDFFEFITPPVLTADITLDNEVLNCDDANLTGSYNVSFFGIMTEPTSSCKKVEDLPFISIVCDVLGFEIFGWQPLKSLYDALRCDKCLAEFISAIIGKLAGGDGGGVIVMADSDGDGNFDYFIENRFGFPVNGTFSVPNRVKGGGKMAVRAVGGWVNSPAEVCGNFDIGSVNILDKIPIGSIPIVGAIIEDILQTAGCEVDVALAVQSDAVATVVNNAEPTFLNCNASGYTFAQTLDCTIPVDWSIPVAIDGCSQDHIPFAGVTSNVDISNYAGTNPPTPVIVDHIGLYQTAGPLPGSVLEPGVYPVTYTAVSCNGLPMSCSFDVVVTSGNPLLECPASITVSTDPDLCTAVVNGLAPYQGIGCASIINYSFINPVSNSVVQTNSTIKGTHNVPDGHAFELGTTTINYTMNVDINGNGDYNDPLETQNCSVNVVVQDHQLPQAKCLDVELHLDNLGHGTVYAAQTANQVYVDAGSVDNCTANPTILISSDNVNYSTSLDFECDAKGQNVVILQVTDASGNTSNCKAVVKVLDYFEGFVLDLSVPQVCFEPFQNSYDFSPYITIAKPDGTNISHQNVGSLGPEVVGAFGISAFLPDAGSTTDPGTITKDGVYTIGTGTGYITISYILSINEQVNQIGSAPLTGCYRMVHDVFRVQKLDPIWKGGFMCCDQPLVWLGGADWDGTGTPPVPPGMISLTDIRGSYPKDAYGEWTGQGVSFVDPDGFPFTGDEFYQFDPNGLDASITLTYIIGDEPCIFTHSQEILVTCQDLQIALSDTTVCPATFIDERVVATNLNDDDLVVTTTGLAALGGVDLVDEPVLDGRVVIPGFQTIAVRNETYTIGVTTYQTTAFGCADYFEYHITVLDTLPPFFQNCPKEPIVVEALPDLCENFVNFEDPWADDQCFSLYTDIQQVDLTGLVSGDLFPVGTTILAYTATDTVGNQSYCELKIVVNDYEQDPLIQCAPDVTTVNDPGNCSAIVPNVSPVLTEDNCLPNNTVTYEVSDKNNEVIYCGFEDASGTEFPVGHNKVKYSIIDQPLVLITEIVQDGIVTGVEVTNFGPASIDLTCAKFILKDAAGIAIEEFVVPTRNNKSTETMQVDFPPLPVEWVLPNPNIVPVGGTFTHQFASRTAVGTEQKYCFAFLDRVIDEVTINGDVDGPVILRKNVCDHDLQSDFIPATPCDPGSFGVLNPCLPTMTDNGTTTSLQNYGPNMSSCTMNVTVNDVEAPRCIMHDSIAIVANLATPLPIGGNACAVSDIVMPAGIVNDVNIKNLQITIADAGAITAYLNSPSGTRIKLFDGLCNGQPNVNVTLDETNVLAQAPSINVAPCNPLGQGGTYKPEESFKAFFGEPAGGTWELEIFTANNVSGTVTNWELEVLNEELYAQQDTILENDTLLCSADFTWTHPIFRDNCCEGTMSVEYAFSNAVTGETSTETQILQSADGSINIDGTRITKTFKVGETVITYTLTDQYGLVSECGFVVTVLDTEVPRFPNGCRNWTLGLDGGECYGALPAIPNVEDNCAMDTITFCDANGASIDVYHLPIGVNKVFMKGIDIYGNVGVCIFDVEIVEHVPTNNTLTCNDNINLSLGPDCTAELNADMILEGDDYYCYENYCISVVDIFGNAHDSQFGIPDIGKTFTVSIIDCVNGVNSCWGYIHIEEKLIPEIECPADVELFCNEDPNAVNAAGKLLTGEVSLLTCEPYAVVSHQDFVNNYGTCQTPRAEIVRRWKVEDNSGNIVYCDQLISFKPFEFDMVNWPNDFYGSTSLSCSDVNDDPSLTTPAHTGTPDINGLNIFGNHYCDVNVGYWDEVLQDANCAVGYEILRHWLIRNECAPLVYGINPMIHIQSIKVDDKAGPKLLPVADVTISTDVWACYATYTLPQVVHDDNCSLYSVKWNVSYGEVIDGVLYHALKGVTHITAVATDACGNVSKTSFNLTVKDRVPPVAVAIQNIVVSLTAVGPNGDGNAKLFPEEFDNGSYDQCTDVKLEIRREDGAPACNNLGLVVNPTTGEKYNNNVTYDNTKHEHDNDKDTDGGQYVKFCCDDLTEIDANGVPFGLVKVWLRVWDDGDMDGVFGSAGDNFTETWSEVRVENKLVPVLTCPPDVTVTCDMDLNISTTRVSTDGIDMTMTGGPATAFTACGIIGVDYQDLPQLNSCNIGTITRRFFVAGRNDIFCVQRITVTQLPNAQPWSVTPPSSAIVNAPCDFNEGDIKDSEKPVATGGPCDVIGESITIDTFYFEDGACKKWRVTYEFINWCTGETKGPFLKYYKYEDPIKPVLADCEDKVIAVDGNCEATVTLTNTASDEGACQGGWLKWQVFVDLWGDGTYDWEFSSFVSGGTNPADNNGNGIPDIFTAATSSGQSKSITIPGVISGSMSNHKVLWKVTDGCGNVTSCETGLMVVDKKAPTPYCESLSSAVMENGQVELWARDFDKGSFDNCTAKENLWFTFNEMHPVLTKLDAVHYFKGAGLNATEAEYNQGNAQKWVPSYHSSSKIFDCDEVPEVIVKMSVWDEKLNTDYCLVTLTLADNQGACNGGSRIAGTLNTLGGNAIEAVTFNIKANLPEYPRTYVVNSSFYYFVPAPYDFEVEADKTDDYKKGISTLDMVLIQKHILGTKKFTDPYLMIAADVSGDNKISIADLVELRNLILGVKSKFNNTSSWQFLPTSELLTMAAPYDYKDYATLTTQADHTHTINMIGVKLGDVSGTIDGLLGGKSAETRSQAKLHLVADEVELKSGQSIDIPIKAKDFKEVFGMQFTTSLTGLILESIGSGALQIAEGSYAKLDEHTMTFTYASDKPLSFADDEVLFTLRCKSTSNVRLSESISLNSNITEAESYTGNDLSIGSVSLLVRSESDASVGFVLYQNEPNPFRADTKITYHCPSNGEVTFTLFDMSGKVVLVKHENALKGLNTMKISRSDINASGMLYYQMESGDFKDMKKMILVD